MEWCGTSSSRRRHPRHRQSTGSSSRSISWTGHDHVVSSPSFFYITTKRLLLFFIIVVVVIFSGGVLQTTASPPQSISLEPSRNQSDSTGSSMPPYATEDLKDTPMDIPDRLNFTPSDSVDWMQYTKDFRFIDISLPGTLHSAMHKIVKPEDETVFSFQRRNVGQQLQDGIRALHVTAWWRNVETMWYAAVRRNSNDPNHDYRGSYMVQASSGLEFGLLQPVKEFLEKYPSEMVQVDFEMMMVEGVAWTLPPYDRWKLEEEAKTSLCNLVFEYWGDMLPRHGSGVLGNLDKVPQEPHFEDPERIKFESGLFRVAFGLLHERTIGELLKQGRPVSSSKKGERSASQENLLDIQRPIRIILFVDTVNTALEWMKQTGQSIVILPAGETIRNVHFAKEFVELCFEMEVDRYGDDATALPSRSARKCQQWCQMYKDCEYFTWTGYDNRCYLKWGPGVIRILHKAVSGPKVCTAKSLEKAFDESGILLDIESQLCDEISINCLLDNSPHRPSHRIPKLLEVDFASPVPTTRTSSFSKPLLVNRGITNLFKWYSDLQTQLQAANSDVLQINVVRVMHYHSVETQLNQSFFQLIMKHFNEGHIKKIHKKTFRYSPIILWCLTGFFVTTFFLYCVYKKSSWRMVSPSRGRAPFLYFERLPAHTFLETSTEELDPAPSVSREESQGGWFYRKPLKLQEKVDSATADGVGKLVSKAMALTKSRGASSASKNERQGEDEEGRGPRSYPQEDDEEEGVTSARIWGSRQHAQTLFGRRHSIDENPNPSSYSSLYLHDSNNSNKDLMGDDNCMQNDDATNSMSSYVQITGKYNLNSNSSIDLNRESDRNDHELTSLYEIGIDDEFNVDFPSNIAAGDPTPLFTSGSRISTGILTPVAGSFSNSSSVTPVTASPRYNGVNDLSPVSTTASSDGFRTGRAVNYAPPTFLPESNVWIKESEEETPVIVNGRKPL